MTPTRKDVEPTTSATDELRTMLDERGVEYEARTSPVGSIWTYWDTFNGHRVYARDNKNGTVKIFGDWDVTPAQAVAVTLGRDNSDVVQRLMELRGGHYGWSRLYRAVTGDFLPLHTSCSENETKFIEKLLTCMVGVGSAETCHNVHEPPKDTPFWPSPHFKCSECGATHVSMEYVFYCPNCGRRVVEEDE